MGAYKKTYTYNMGPICSNVHVILVMVVDFKLPKSTKQNVAIK